MQHCFMTPTRSRKKNESTIDLQLQIEGSKECLFTYLLNLICLVEYEWYLSCKYAVYEGRSYTTVIDYSKIRYEYDSCLIELKVR